MTQVLQRLYVYYKTKPLPRKVWNVTITVESQVELKPSGCINNIPSGIY